MLEKCLRCCRRLTRRLPHLTARRELCTNKGRMLEKLLQCCRRPPWSLPGASQSLQPGGSRAPTAGECSTIFSAAASNSQEAAHHAQARGPGAGQLPRIFGSAAPGLLEGLPTNKSPETLATSISSSFTRPVVTAGAACCLNEARAPLSLFGQGAFFPIPHTHTHPALHLHLWHRCTFCQPAHKWQGKDIADPGGH